MTIKIQINNPQKMSWLVGFLKSLDFVIGVKVEVPTTKKATFFEQYNGCMPQLDVNAFEKHINSSRNEWQRDIY
jgi:hypothetical protein